MNGAKQSEEADEDAILAELGITTVAQRTGELRAACTKIARRIHADKVRVIGFVPGDKKVAVLPVIIHLGLALCELTGAPVAVVDANVRYPGLPPLRRKPNDPADDPDDKSVYKWRWLRGSLAVLSPVRERAGKKVEHQAGEVVPQLARVLLEDPEVLSHILVDLTGFELIGEHASAAACMDAVALVARAHHTHEGNLLDLAQAMPRGRFLGVLLVG